MRRRGYCGWAWAGLVLACAVGGCGIITAGVSVPEAFTHNGDLGLKGTIIDDRGGPMDAVRVMVKREYYLWHANASYSEFDTTTMTQNHAFDFPQRRAHELTFTFRQSGYVDQAIIVGQNAIRADFLWVEGTGWPLNTPVRVIMQKADRQPAPLQWLAVDVDYTDPEKNPVIDLGKLLPASADPGFGWSRERTVELSKGAVSVLAPGAGVSAGSLVASVSRQAVRTTAPDGHIDPLDLNLPAGMGLRFADGGEGGFVVVVPEAGSNPLAQMMEAPEAGYGPALELPGQRLRQLRNAASGMVSERNVFFYFRAGGKYGKGVVSWSRTGMADQNGPLRLFVVLMVQPDGGRGLALRNGL